MQSRSLWVYSISCGAFLLVAGAGAPQAADAPPALAAAADPKALPADGWLARAQRHIAEREYWASANDAGLQAPNRRHNLRSYFESTGVRVHDRSAPGEPRLLGLELVGLGRARPLAAPAPGRVVSDGARVEIRRPDLVEWYLNSPDGLEQGFTLSRRPDGEGPLVLELALSGARAQLVDGELAIRTDTGRQLAYGALVALDADGDPVEARFELPAEDRIALVVEDRGVPYPLTLDPLLTATADTQLESNQINVPIFGGAVAGAGDVNGDGYADVIVGAEEYDSGTTNEGAAFVFYGSATGVPNSNPASAGVTLLESNQINVPLFGTSVAGAGDVNGDGYADVIVGSEQYDNGQTNEGAAFVFYGSATGIPTPSNPASAGVTQLESNNSNAFFGTSVAGAGDGNGDGYADVIVGALEFDSGTIDEGAAFVFYGVAGGIPDSNVATPGVSRLESNQINVPLFGTSVAGAGDVNGDGYADVIVGAEEYDSGTTDEGAAFVFHGSATGVPNSNPATAGVTRLESNQANVPLFGGTVAGAGDVNGDGYADVLVGAPEYDNGQTNEGAAFVFYGAVGGIPNSNPATAGVTQLESDQGSAFLGGSVAGAGDVNGDGYADLIAGASDYNGGLAGEGAAFVFLGRNGGIADGNLSAAAAQLESNQGNAFLGGSVAGAGDVNGDGYADVIVGADSYTAGTTDEGAAFVFHGGASGIANGDPTTAGQLESDQASASLGENVAGAGDVNGDGYADVIVGAHSYDAGTTDEGAAFVFYGGASGIPDSDPGTTGVTQLESNQTPTPLFGLSVAGAGDVNGDGYADVIVGAEAYDSGTTNEGAAFVFYGDAGGIPDSNPATAGVTRLESNQGDALLGGSVAGAGDVNGDGYADVIVGADGYDAGETEEGAAFVFHGSSTGVADGNPSTAATQLESNQDYAELRNVAGAGDVNGDGYADVIVGASEYNAGLVSEGAAFVFHGGASGIADGNPTTATTQLESDQLGAFLGVSVAAAGDVNGDGYSDVIVGAYLYSAGQSGEGGAFVFPGGASGVADGTPASAMARLEANQVDAGFGVRVAGAGDVNGDGYADVIVGAPGYDAGQSNEGAAFVFLGSAAGVAHGNPATAASQLESNQDSGQLGSVAGAGDVNGDGYADVIVGAQLYDAGESNEGAAFVFLGNGDGDGRAVVAEQERDDGGSIPVQPWGSSEGDGTSFKIALTATHPEGRGRVKLELEVCPSAAPFDDGSCTTQVGASWTDVTATAGGVRLVEVVSGLSSGTLYRWRARVLHAPFRVTEAGITPPPNPAHGPWRRVQAQAVEADIRALPEPSQLVMLVSALGLLLAVGRRRIRA